MSEEPIKIFYSYSRKDLEMRNTLEDHLSALREANRIETWHDLELEAGTEWEPVILKKLDTADIILLLVSRNFIASKYCYGTELKRAIARHDAGTARVIPIILRDCDWNHSHVPFSRLNVLPDHAEPITRKSWVNQDAAFTIVARRIRETVDELTKKKLAEQQAQEQPRQAQIAQQEAEQLAEQEPEEQERQAQTAHLKQQQAAAAATAPTRVFISYSWDSEQHKTEVLNLAKSLRRNGVDCIIDRHYEIPPPEIGWYLWMKKQIQTSKFVLVVCTEKYLKRYDKEEESGKGQDVAWEGGVITAELYENQGKNKKFIPVVLSSTANSSQSIIPTELVSTNIYYFANNNYNCLENQVYEKLLRHLFNEPATPVSELGDRPVFPNPKQSNWAVQTVSTNELLSEKGVNYTKLRDLLQANKWKEADEETLDRMCEVMGRQEESWLRSEDIQEFPCADLRIIDQLWTHHSKAKFGFSVQKKIWREHGSPRTYNKNWEKFGEEVGWKKNFMYDWWKNYSELTFNASAPSGHLPSLIGICMASGHEDPSSTIHLMWLGVALFSRVKACNL